MTFDVITTQEFYMKENSSMDFPQHDKVFYFYGQALHIFLKIMYVCTYRSTYLLKKITKNLILVLLQMKFKILRNSSAEK
jgi:hypothetical protein